MPEKTVHSVPCPIADCSGQVKIPDSLQAGEYSCPCYQTRLRLGWAVYLQEGRKPYLSALEKQS